MGNKDNRKPASKGNSRGAKNKDDDVEEIPRQIPYRSAPGALVSNTGPTLPPIMAFSNAQDTASFYMQMQGAVIAAPPAVALPAAKNVGKSKEQRGEQKDQKKDQIKSEDQPKNGNSSKDKAKTGKPENYVRLRQEDAICGNCDLRGHWLKQCYGPANRYGFIPGCPHCNVTTHILEECTSYDPTTDEDRLCWFMDFVRKDMPPLECSIDPDQHTLARPGQKHAHDRPWSTDYTLQYAKDHPEYWKTHEYNTDPKNMIKLEADPCWDNDDSVFVMGNSVPLSGRRVTATRPVPKKRKRGGEGEGDATAENSGPANKGNRDGAGDEEMTESSIAPDVWPPSARPFGTQKFHEKYKNTTCLNCGLKGHIIGMCKGVCGCCGEKGHNKKQCPSIRQICCCSDWPHHLKYNCNVVCEMDGCGNETPHKAVSCNIRCFMCGQINPGHYSWECNWEIRCVCESKHHRGGNCPDVANPDKVKECEANGCFAWNCWKHCSKCLQECHMGVEKGSECSAEVTETSNGKQVICIKKHPPTKWGEQCNACMHPRSLP